MAELIFGESGCRDSFSVSPFRFRRFKSGTDQLASDAGAPVKSPRYPHSIKPTLIAPKHHLKLATGTFPFKNVLPPVLSGPPPRPPCFSAAQALRHQVVEGLQGGAAVDVEAV